MWDPPYLGDAHHQAGDASTGVSQALTYLSLCSEYVREDNPVCPLEVLSSGSYLFPAMWPLLFTLLSAIYPSFPVSLSVTKHDYDLTSQQICVHHFLLLLLCFYFISARVCVVTCGVHRGHAMCPAL